MNKEDINDPDKMAEIMNHQYEGLRLARRLIMDLNPKPTKADRMIYRSALSAVNVCLEKITFED
jgi:hypothetical protein